MKILRVGDYHAQVSNLTDCIALLDFIEKTAKKEKVKQIELMGDTFHNHAVKRVEVEYFVKNMLERLSSICPVIVLVGNHDMILGKSAHAGKHALEPFKDIKDVYIVDKPVVYNNIGYIPYIADHRGVSQASEELFEQGAEKLLVGHLTVDGAKYENGFYSEEGVSMELIAQEKIISGHIHKSGEIGKCFYTGTAKWDTMSSAGQDKGIWVFNHNKNGSVKSKKFIDTSKIVTPIYKLDLLEGEEEDFKLPKRGKIYLTCKGKSAWIKKMKKKHGAKVSFKGIPTDKRKAVNRSQNEDNSFDGYISEYFTPVHGVTSEEICKYLKGVA